MQTHLCIFFEDFCNTESQWRENFEQNLVHKFLDKSYDMATFKKFVIKPDLKGKDGT